MQVGCGICRRNVEFGEGVVTMCCRRWTLQGFGPLPFLGPGIPGSLRSYTRIYLIFGKHNARKRNLCLFDFFETLLKI